MFTSDHCADCGNFILITRPVYVAANGGPRCPECQEQKEQLKPSETKGTQ